MHQGLHLRSCLQPGILQLPFTVARSGILFLLGSSELLGALVLPPADIACSSVPKGIHSSPFILAFNHT